jgi:protein transport protein SEC24
MNQICDYTNGNIYFYKNFRMETHYKNLFNQIRRSLTKNIAWESVMRTRFSRGYKISSFTTPVLISNNDLLVLPQVDGDQSYTMCLDVSEHNELQKAIDNYVYIQSALLYTHSDGTRRIRIHNLCLPVANKLYELYDSIDVEALVSYYLKSTIDKIFKTKKCNNSILATESNYKTLVSNVLSSQQSLKKQLPDNLIYLPLYILGMLKHRVCCKDELDKKLDVDVSNYLRIKLQKLNVDDCMTFIYPRIYNFTEILTNPSIGSYNENGMIILPSLTSTHYSGLAADGMFLIDNGFMLVLYTKMNTDKKLINSVFGVNSLSELTPPVLEDNIFGEADEIKQGLINLIDYIRSTKSLFQNMIFVFEGTDGERM